MVIINKVFLPHWKEMPCSLLCPPSLAQSLAQRRHFAKTGWRLLIRWGRDSWEAGWAWGWAWSHGLTPCLIKGGFTPSKASGSMSERFPHTSNLNKYPYIDQTLERLVFSFWSFRRGNSFFERAVPPDRLVHRLSVVTIRQFECQNSQHSCTVSSCVAITGIYQKSGFYPEIVLCPGTSSCLW